MARMKQLARERGYSVTCPKTLAFFALSSLARTHNSGLSEAIDFLENFVRLAETMEKTLNEDDERSGLERSSKWSAFVRTKTHLVQTVDASKWVDLPSNPGTGLIRRQFSNIFNAVEFSDLAKGYIDAVSYKNCRLKNVTNLLNAHFIRYLKAMETCLPLESHVILLDAPWIYRKFIDIAMPLIQYNWGGRIFTLSSDELDESGWVNDLLPEGNELDLSPCIEQKHSSQTYQYYLSVDEELRFPLLLNNSNFESTDETM